jgi:hypothetical protein
MGAECATENQMVCGIDIVICINGSKKNREENKFSSRVEVRDCCPESFQGCYRALGLSASFSSLFFSLLLSFFSLPSTLFPPFNPQHAEICEELGMTSLTRVQ